MIAYLRVLCIEICNATISVEIIKNSHLFIARLDMQLRNCYPIGLREMC